jgi:hydrogenase maturation protein HypF
VTARIARRVRVYGVVQGVGFRPFVSRAATRRGLGGAVRNTGSGVEIEVEGEPEAQSEFVDDLVAGRASLAHLDDVQVENTEPCGGAAFTIDRPHDGDGVLPVAPDVATCPACLNDVFDPSTRRFGDPATPLDASGRTIATVKVL